MKMNTTEEIISDIAAGKMVIIMDDEDRENEGDLIVASEFITPEIINFMATYGRGLICQTMTAERCEQLNLPMMVQQNGAHFATNFTVSIEAAEGVSTGISAADRARTVQAAVAKDAKPTDIVQPGHIFPLRAQNGGVIVRAGHTEAGCDFARLAGLEPSAVIVEILNEDGTMARRPDLEIFAKKHDLKIGTIADLIEYRNLNESSIKRVAQCHFPTQFGDFNLVTYKDTIENHLHYALIKGDLDSNTPTLVRVHLQNTLQGLIAQTTENNDSWSVQNAMKKIGQEGGVLVLINGEDSTEQLASLLQGHDVLKTELTVPTASRAKHTGLGSQILADLGVEKLKLMGRKRKYPALSGYKLEVIEYLEPKALVNAMAEAVAI